MDAGGCGPGRGPNVWNRAGHGNARALAEAPDRAGGFGADDGEARRRPALVDQREDFVAEEGRRLLVGEVVHAHDEAEGIRIVRLVARRAVVAVDAVGESVGGGRTLVLPPRLQHGPGSPVDERQSVVEGKGW